MGERASRLQLGHSPDSDDAFMFYALGAGKVDTDGLQFEQIMEAVAAGRVEAGLLIHEGQLTHGRLGLHNVLDLGVWWDDRTGLPLPLGINAVRRDLGADVEARVSRVLRASIEYGLQHRQAALEHALGFARGMATAVADRFVGMYVNELTRDMGPRGRRAI